MAMKKFVYFSVLICSVTFFMVIVYDSHRTAYQISSGIYFTCVTPTIQTISVYANGKDQNLGFTSLLRGHVLRFGVVDKYIVGYLSMASVAEDGLAGLERDADKEGLFVVNIATREVLSGLTDDELDIFLEKNAKYSVTQIEFIAEPRRLFSSGCGSY